MSDQENEKIQALSADLRASRDQVAKLEHSNRRLASIVSTYAEEIARLKEEKVVSVELTVDGVGGP